MVEYGRALMVAIPGMQPCSLNCLWLLVDLASARVVQMCSTLLRVRTLLAGDLHILGWVCIEQSMAAAIGISWLALTVFYAHEYWYIQPIPTLSMSLATLDSTSPQMVAPHGAMFAPTTSLTC